MLVFCALYLHHHVALCAAGSIIGHLSSIVIDST